MGNELRSGKRDMRQFSLLFLLITGFLIISASYTFASSSPSYSISVEAFGGGGEVATSTNHTVQGLIRSPAYGIRTSTNYMIGEGFMNASFNALTLQPLISSITPSSGNDTGLISVTINGANFLAGAVASLERTAQTDISGESLTVVNSGQITCNFNLTNRTTGAWDVVVTNTDGTVGTLAGGFTIIKPSGRLVVVGRPINYPNPFDPDKEPTTIKYTLSKDAAIVLSIYNINGERIWQESYAPGANGGKSGVNQILWDGYTRFSQVVPNGIYVYQIASKGETLATGKIAVFR